MDGTVVETTTSSSSSAAAGGGSGLNFIVTNVAKVIYSINIITKDHPTTYDTNQYNQGQCFWVTPFH